MKARPYLARTSFCAFAALQMVCAQALSIQHYPIPTQGTLVRSSVGATVNLTVVDASSRQSLPIYWHRGEFWVAGTPGQRYELWMNSRLSDRRQLATTSVDGINVITGETAATLGRGYVLSPNTTSTVTGWRKSEHEVAAFNFAAPQASYAAQTGRPSNVGVIGVAVFPEMMPEVPVGYAPLIESERSKKDKRPSGKNESYRQAVPSPTNPNTAAASGLGKSQEADGLAPSEAKAVAKNSTYASPNTNTPVQQALGTQHGERVLSYAPSVAFKRASNTPNEVITLRYDTVENLIARGVLHLPPYTLPTPQPVPTPFPNRGYVPDPPQQ